jgi:3-hydroxyacyl-[acyl-carrier-protein] dehydratase
LIRASEDFAHSIVVLKEARTVKYGHFVEPGETLGVAAEIVSQTDRETTLKARGAVGGRVAATARLILERFDLGDAEPAWGETDEVIRQELREQFALLWRSGGGPNESTGT